VPEPTGIQQLEHLDNDVLGLMIRHDQLRSLVSSIIIETELDPLELSEEERQQATTTYRQRHNLNSTKDIQNHCKRHGFNQSQLQWQIQLQEQIVRNSKNRFANKAELHYLRRKEQFDRVSYTQLIVKNQHLAQELFLRIKEDEADFIDLVTELTRGSDRKPPWQVGPIPMRSVPKPLIKPLQSNSPGTLLEPIRVQANWFVVRLEQYQPTEFDEIMEQRMCMELFQQHVDQLVDEQIEAITSQLSQKPLTNES
tara:strand:+ start:130 stop:891 length:762 start_codon:yes stop_codon:yes gene_type:complete